MRNVMDALPNVGVALYKSCCRRVFQPPFIGHFPVIFQLTFGVHVYIVCGCRLRAKLIGAALRPASDVARWAFAPVF